MRHVLVFLRYDGTFCLLMECFIIIGWFEHFALLQVHQLLNNWNETQKANFIRHVTREYEVGGGDNS